MLVLQLTNECCRNGKYMLLAEKTFLSHQVCKDEKFLPYFTGLVSAERLLITNQSFGSYWSLVQWCGPTLSEASKDCVLQIWGRGVQRALVTYDTRRKLLLEKVPEPCLGEYLGEEGWWCVRLLGDGISCLKDREYLGEEEWWCVSLLGDGIWRLSSFPFSLYNGCVHLRFNEVFSTHKSNVVWR